MSAGPDIEQRAAGSSGTPEAPEELSLAAEFDTPDRARWRELVAGALSKSGREVRAEDAEAAIATVTDDGFEIAALYTAQDAPDVATGAPGLPPFTRAARPQGHVAEGWAVRQRHAFPAGVDRSTAHDVVMADLENGVSSLWLVLGEAGGPAIEALGALLDGVLLDLAPISLTAGRDTPEAAAALLRLAADHGVVAALGGSLGYDPLLARTRGGPPLTEAYLEAMVEHSRAAASDHPVLATVVADGLPYHEAGGSDAQELGAALAAGLHAVRLLTEGGAASATGSALSVDDAFARVEFRLAATADQFTTLAKLRAARRCWERIGSVAGASETARAMRQHAVTSPAMMTTRDPWVNILRTTVAAVGAGLGGADAVTVLPFDTALGLPDDFSRRIARNTQALLLEESHLAHVIDPAGGSWYVESLTDELAHAAWEVFTTIESAGGAAAALADGSLAAALERTWSRRSERIAHRRDPITGVSEFPNLHEVLPERTPASGDEHGDPGLPRRRYAQVFEDLRDRADAAPQRPVAFLATVGSLAQYTARASFATNLLHAGGIDVVTGPGGTDLDATVAAFREAGTPVAVVASSDKIYAEHAADLAGALAEAGATRVLLAGPPTTPGLGPDDATALTGYLHTGCDAAGLLTDLLEDLTGKEAA